MTRNEEIIETIENNSKAPSSSSEFMHFYYSATTSDFFLRYNDLYEACIRGDEENKLQALTLNF
jgi:hypothetical protein